MKLLPVNSGGGPAALRRHEGGMATLLFLALLAIMMLLVTAETRALIGLHREVKLLEQEQLKRLNAPPSANPVATVVPP
jgi:hypothetical protein